MLGANPNLLQKELDILAWPQKYIVNSSEKNYRQSSFVKTYCMEEPIGFSFRDCRLLCSIIVMPRGEIPRRKDVQIIVTVAVYNAGATPVIATRSGSSRMMWARAGHPTENENAEKRCQRISTS